jgi:hypothetical protein
MRLSEFTLDKRLVDALPPPGAGAATPPPTVPGQTQNVATDPQAQAKMMAQQAVDLQNRKKELQDQIKAKQQELMDLQKELASIK